MALPSKYKNMSRPAGRLLQLNAKNFMCHAHMELDFGEYVTFISGKNGSGKSASLQALQVCLGAKARTTGRASSLSGLVSHGKPKAVVRVTLSNLGDNAFRPDLYGPVIHVERTIPGPKPGGGSGGAGTVVLLNAREERVSSRRADLEMLCEHFGIDASNPAAILTQDTAKTFLSSEHHSDRKMYELYMEATMLQSVADRIRDGESLRAQLEEVIVRYAAEMQEEQAAVDQLARTVQQIMDLQTAMQKQDTLMTLGTWALYEDTRRNADQAAQQARQAPERLLAAEMAASELVSELAGLERQEAQLAARMQSEVDAKEARARELEDLKRRQRELADERRKAQRDLDDCRRQLEDKERQRQGLLDDMKRVSGDDLVQQAQQALKQFEQDKQGLEEQEDAARRAVQELDEQLMDAGEQRGRAEHRLGGLRQRVQQLQGDLNKLRRAEEDQQRAKSNRIAIFGQPVAQLVDRIRQEAARFRSQPIGPLGAYVSVKDGFWTEAVHHCIGATARVFLCDNDSDRARLVALAQHCGVRSVEVIVTPFSRPALQPNPANLPRLAPTVLSQLVFEHPSPDANRVIRNTLIDYCKVEKNALVDNEARGTELAMTNQVPDPNISRVYLPNGSYMDRRGDGSSSHISSHINGHNPVLIGGVAERSIELTRQQLAARERELEEARREEQEIGADLRRLQQRYESLRQQKSRALADESRASGALRMHLTQNPATQLASQAGASAGEQLEEIKQELEALAHEMNALEKLANMRKEAVSRLQGEAKELERQARAIREGQQDQAAEEATEKEARQLLRAKHTANQRLQAREAEVAQLRAVAVEAEARARVLEEHVAQLHQGALESLQGLRGVDQALLAEEPEAVIEALRDGMAKWLSQRRGAGRLPPERLVRDSGALAGEIERLNAQLQRAERDLGSPEDQQKTILEHERRKEQLSKRLRPLESAKSLRRAMKLALDARKATVQSMADSTKRNTNYMFQIFMGRKGHTGEIILVSPRLVAAPRC